MEAFDGMKREHTELLGRAAPCAREADHYAWAGMFCRWNAFDSHGANACPSIAGLKVTESRRQNDGR
jgi:hypothetical protein